MDRDTPLDRTVTPPREQDLTLPPRDLPGSAPTSGRASFSPRPGPQSSDGGIGIEP
jgi:hypothetical protein